MKNDLGLYLSGDAHSTMAVLCPQPVLRMPPDTEFCWIRLGCDKGSELCCSNDMSACMTLVPLDATCMVTLRLEMGHEFDSEL